MPTYEVLVDYCAVWSEHRRVFANDPDEAMLLAEQLVPEQAYSGDLDYVEAIDADEVDD